MYANLSLRKDVYSLQSNSCTISLRQCTSWLLFEVLGFFNRFLYIISHAPCIIRNDNLLIKNGHNETKLLPQFNLETYLSTLIQTSESRFALTDEVQK